MHPHGEKRSIAAGVTMRISFQETPLKRPCRFLAPRDLLVDPQCLESSGQPEISHDNAIYSHLDLNGVGEANATVEDIPRLHARLENETCQPSPSGTNVRGRRSEPGNSMSLERSGGYNRKALTTTRSINNPSCEQLVPTKTVARSRVRKAKARSRHHCFFEQELSRRDIAQLQELAGVDEVGDELQSEIFRKLALAISQTSSNRYLDTLLDGYCKNKDGRTHTQSTDLLQMSVQDRIHKISALDEQLAFEGFLRTFHVYKLVSDIVYGQQEAEGSFFVTTPESVRSARSRLPGNSLMRAQAQVHEAMMKIIFPSILNSSPLYNQKYEEIKQLRRCGCRLRQLAMYFGEGLFVLVPLQGPPTDSVIGLLGHA